MEALEPVASWSAIPLVRATTRKREPGYELRVAAGIQPPNAHSSDSRAISSGDAHAHANARVHWVPAVRIPQPHATSAVAAARTSSGSLGRSSLEAVEVHCAYLDCGCALDRLPSAMMTLVGAGLASSGVVSG